MKQFLYLIFSLSMGVLAMAGMTAFFAVESQPFLQGKSGGGDSYGRAEQWIEHLESAFASDQLNRLVLQPSDIRDLIYHSARRAKVSGKKLIHVEGVATELEENTVTVKASLKPMMIEDVFFNITLVIRDDDGLPDLEYVQVGKAYLPGFVLNWGFKTMILPMVPKKKAQLWQAVTGSVKGFRVVPGQVTLVYRSDKELKQQLKASALELMVGSKEEREALQLYLDVLAAAAAQQAGTELSLSKLLRTMVGLAKSRSENGGSAVEENKRMLRAFALQVSEPPVRALLAPGMRPVPLTRPIVLKGRKDLSQHFLVSAALALTLDEETALNIGVNKEKSDAQAGGSGFNFTDLLADMAGIRFASVATENETRARWLQAYLLANRGEHVFMPDISWLPQNLSAAAYDDLIRHPLYPALLDKILKRLNALPVLNNG